MGVYDMENDHGTPSGIDLSGLPPGMFGGGGPPAAPPTVYKSRGRRRRWLRVLIAGLICLLVLLIGGGIWTYAWLKGKESRMKVPAVIQEIDRKQSGQPDTTLIVGVDKGSVPGEEESRSDIIMLVSVNASGDKAAVISIPRDTRVKIPGRKGYDKINAAHAYGASGLTIDTVRDFTGLPINHYVEIDFEGFKQIVNALGGVRMNVEKAIHDKYAGDVPAGDVLLNGDQALALVRARHDLKSVPGGDLDRVQNQRKFLQAMLATIAHQRNPFKLMDVVEAVSVNVKTDMSFMKMLALGRKLRGHDLEMTTVPGKPKMSGGAWYYIADMDAFQEMISSFKTRQQVPSEGQLASEQRAGRADVKVSVLNGSGTAGLAKTVAERLAGLGYGAANSANAASNYSKTTIYYAIGEKAKADLVAADVGADGPAMQESGSIPASYGVPVVVVIGSDYNPS